eukprot:4233703-Lingulodinium_polyedra.AAC.1
MARRLGALWRRAARRQLIRACLMRIRASEQRQQALLEHLHQLMQRTAAGEAELDAALERIRAARRR